MGMRVGGSSAVSAAWQSQQQNAVKQAPPVASTPTPNPVQQAASASAAMKSGSTFSLLA